MKKLRIGIIGAGGIAQSRHIPVLMKLSDSASITAICDVNEDTALQAAKNLESATFLQIIKNYSMKQML